MARPGRPASESYQSPAYCSVSQSASYTTDAVGLQDVDDQAPIFSLSKSSMDVVMATGPPHKRDPAWTRLDLRRSSSTNTHAENNTVTLQQLHPQMWQHINTTNSLAAQHVDVPGPPALSERWISNMHRWSGSTHSRSSTPDTIVWKGGTSRPSSLTQDIPGSPSSKPSSPPTTPSPLPPNDPLSSSSSTLTPGIHPQEDLFASLSTSSPLPSPLHSRTYSTTSSPLPSPFQACSSSPTPSPLQSPLRARTSTSRPSSLPSPLQACTSSPQSSPLPSPLKTCTSSPRPSSLLSPLKACTSASRPSSLPSPLQACTSSPTSSPLPSPLKARTSSPTSSPLPSPLKARTSSPTSSPLPSPLKARSSSPTSSPLPSPLKARTSSPTSSPLPSPLKARTSSPTSSPLPSPLQARTSSLASPLQPGTSSPTPSLLGSPLQACTLSPTPSLLPSPMQSRKSSPLQSPLQAHTPSTTPSALPSPLQAHTPLFTPSLLASPLQPRTSSSNTPNRLQLTSADDKGLLKKNSTFFKFPSPIQSSVSLAEGGTSSDLGCHVEDVIEEPHSPGGAPLSEGEGGRSPVKMRSYLKSPADGHETGRGASVRHLELPGQSRPTWNSPLVSSLSDSLLGDGCRCNLNGREGITKACVFQEEGTMTSPLELVDAAVQTVSPLGSLWGLRRNTSNMGSHSFLGSPPGSRLNLKSSVGSASNLVSPSSSMFPVSSGEEVDEERRGDDAMWEIKSIPSHNLERRRSCLKMKILQGEERDEIGRRGSMKQVQWDEDGMTWDVHGASVDPEVLSSAIRKHLEQRNSPKSQKRPSKKKKAPKPPLISDVVKAMAPEIHPPATCNTSTCMVEGDRKGTPDGAGRAEEVEGAGKKEEAPHRISRAEGAYVKEEEEVYGEEGASSPKSPERGSGNSRKKSVIRSLRWCGGSKKTEKMDPGASSKGN